MNSIIGTVVEMDISHMVAAVAVDEDNVIDIKVGKIYDVGDDVKVYDVEKFAKPWFLQGTEWIDQNPISEAEILKGNITGIKLC
jgi:hypothetical protein